MYVSVCSGVREMVSASFCVCLGVREMVSAWRGGGATGAADGEWEWLCRGASYASVYMSLSLCVCETVRLSVRPSSHASFFKDSFPLPHTTLRTKTGEAAPGGPAVRIAGTFLTNTPLPTYPTDLPYLPFSLPYLPPFYGPDCRKRRRIRRRRAKGREAMVVTGWASRATPPPASSSSMPRRPL